MLVPEVDVNNKVPNFGSLDGRVVLITGGAGHIGSTLRAAFRSVGSAVATVDVVGTDSEQVDDNGWQHFKVDLTDRESTSAVIDRVIDTFGHLDIIVAAASWMGTATTPGWNAPFIDQDEGLWADVIDVGVTATFTLVKHATPHLLDSGNGSIILISSISGFCGPQPEMYRGTDINNIAGYAASKGALGQLGRWLATTLAPDVRVNTVSPGGVFRDQDPVFVSRYEDRTPLGRMATEDDLIGPVLFLASDLSSYMTGHDLVVDGGFSAW